MNYFLNPLDQQSATLGHRSNIVTQDEMMPVASLSVETPLSNPKPLKFNEDVKKWLDPTFIYLQISLLYLV